MRFQFSADAIKSEKKIDRLIDEMHVRLLNSIQGRSC